MSISAVGSAPVTHAMNAERAEGPGPDHDGDSDDADAVSQTATPAAALSPGTGQAVNKIA